MSETVDDPASMRPTRIPLGGCLLRLALCAAFGPLVGAGIAWLQLRSSGGDEALHEIAFDSARWLDAETSTKADNQFHTPRQAMARDLVEHVVKPGMRHEELRQMLGAPSRWPVLDAAAWWGAEDEAYFLGKAPGMIEHGDDWLWLDYDAQGVLVRAKVLGENADREREP